MLTSKQRAVLRGFANDLDTILHIGKGGITETLTVQADEALAARELIKIRALESAPEMIRDSAHELARRVGADVVQVIGSKAVLFRQNKKDSKFEL